MHIPHALAGGLVAVASLLLVGCSSSIKAQSSTHTTAVSPGGTVPFDPAKNARADLTVGTCTEASGAWLLKGTVRNPGAKKANFQIVVDYVTKVGSTVLATTVVDVPGVGPGATAPWSATGARGKSDVACIVRLAQTT